MRFSPGCQYCSVCGGGGVITCDCVNAHATLFMTMSGFTDKDCRLAVCDSTGEAGDLAPVSCLNGSHQLDASGGVFVENSTACAGAALKHLSLSCLGDTLSGEIRVSAAGACNYERYDFSATMAELMAVAGNTCSPLNLDISSFVQRTELCGVINGFTPPGLSVVITE